METKQTPNNTIVVKGIFIGIAAGCLVGLAVGAIVGNWRVWVSFGASLGFAIGLLAAVVLANKQEQV